MRIFLSAGEASGDTYAAALVEEMRRLSPAGQISTDDILNRLGVSTSIPRETPVEDVEAIDPLEVVEVAMALEDEFGITASEEELSGGMTVADMVHLVRRQAAATATLTFEGIGGNRLASTGSRIIANSSGWGAISIAQALRVAFKALPGYYKAKAALARGTPGLFIPIDFGYANIRLAKHAKKSGWKVLYFMPPGSWRRDKQGKDLPAIADEIVTPFSWSAEILGSMGARVHWFGHPIKQLMRESSKEATERDPRRIAVLPGSRTHEVELNLPVIAEALKDWPGTAEFAVASSIDPAELQQAWKTAAKGRTGDLFTQGDIYGVFGRAQAAIVCSGTATLEAALCRCPMVVIYRLTAGMVAEARLLGLKRPRFISLPNILLQRDAVPELVHTDLTPKAVKSHLEDLLGTGAARGEQLKAFAEIERLLGPDDAITRTAELALSLCTAPGEPHSR